MLNFVGAPKIERSMTEDIRTRTGWFWHDHLGKLLVEAGVPVMREVNLTPWMPELWSGTADWLFWSPRYQAFVLGDLKTTKGEAIKYRNREGMSADHWWQLSAYWYACVKMGLPMVKGFGILYLPMNTKLGEDVEPTIMEADPVPEDELTARMDEVKAAVIAYEDSIPHTGPVREFGKAYIEARGPELYLTDALAPPMDRVQKLFWKPADKVWEVKLVPHWLADFCPYPNELCDCSEQGTTKIGTWYWGTEASEGFVRPQDGTSGKLFYHNRKGYDILPEVMPDEKEVKRRGK